MTLATATRQTWSVLIIPKIKNHAQLPQILHILPTLLRIYGIVGKQLVSLVFYSWECRTYPCVMHLFCGRAAVQFDFYFRSLVCKLCRLVLRCLRDKVWRTITASINARSSNMIGERNHLCVMTVWESVISRSTTSHCYRTRWQCFQFGP